MKPNRSLPSNRKVEPHSYQSLPMKSENNAFEKKQSKRQVKGKDIHTSLADKNPTVYDQPV